MKNESTILLASGFGLFVVTGFFALQKFLRDKKFKDYYHRFEALKENQSAEDGIEFYAYR